MKKTKYRVQSVAAAAVLMMAFLLSNCAEPLGVSDPANHAWPTPPAGMAYIRLNVSTPPERAVFVPDVPPLSALFFDLTITAAPGDGTTIPLQNVDFADFSTPFPVAYGNYTISVNAYTNAGRTLLVATGTAQIAVTANTPVSVPMLAIPRNTSTQPGTFAWEIDLPSTFQDASMTLIPLTANAHTPVLTATRFASGALDLAGIETDDEDIPAGFYRVVIVATGDGDFEDRTVASILHITQNMTTTALIDVAELNPIIRYTVAFNHNDGDPPTTPHTVTPLEYTHSQLLADNPGFAALPAVGTTAGFLGWFTADGPAWGSQWALGTARVFRSISLFGRWQEDLQLTINLVPIPDFDEFMPVPPISTTLIFYRTDLPDLRPPTPVLWVRDISFGTPGGVNFVQSSIVWRDFNGVQLPAGDGSFTLSLDFSTTLYGAVGTRPLSVTVQDDNQNWWGASFNIVTSEAP